MFEKQNQIDVEISQCVDINKLIVFNKTNKNQRNLEPYFPTKLFWGPSIALVVVN